MITRFSRREVLRWTALSSAHFAIPLAGCGSDPTDPGPTPFDPSRPWWLQGNYAPVDGETEAFELEVEGALPPSLDGIYLRNGPNSESGHWFLGDGMVHGVRLSGGNARWYRRRYVQTPLLDRSGMGGLMIPTIEENASNVSLLHHAGRTLTLGEVGLPFELSAEDLSTIGLHDYDGALATAMTAHPKIDAVTGELLMFGYWFTPPYLTYHHVDAEGVLTRSEAIDIPASTMMHDFAITERYVVFMDLPIVFDINIAIEGGSFPFEWDPSNGARLGVMPRDGGNADVRWFDIPPCYVFHVMNAYESGERIVLAAVRHPQLWVDGADDFRAEPALHQWTIDLEAGTVSEQPLDERLIEFPQLDRRRVGREYRYGYALHLGRDQGDVAPKAASAFLQFDHTTGERTAHELPAGQQPDEAIFVADSEASGENEGWLLSYVYDHATDRSDLLVLDASNLAAAPVARVKLPFRVPFGFHGIWVPA